MAAQFQITIDAEGPRDLAGFWCEVLGYVEQPPPPGFDTWEEALTAFGIDQSDPDRATRASVARLAGGRSGWR